MRQIRLIIAAIIMISPFAANAVPIVIDITPSDGAWFTMTGSFDYDAGTSTYSNMTVNITGDIGPFSFTDTACDTCPLSGSSIGLIDPTVTLNFLSDFTVTWGGGALDAIFRGGSVSVNSSSGRIDGEYSFRIASVPEPGTLALLGIGLAGIGFSRRRKKV